MPALTWQPTDPNPNHLKSIEAWRRQSGVANVAPPFALDATRPGDLAGGDGKAAGASTRGDRLDERHSHRAVVGVRGHHADRRARSLERRASCPLWAIQAGGEHTAPSNAAFDASLRRENPQWGVRDVQEVEAAAAARGLRLGEVVEMPANNLTARV